MSDHAFYFAESVRVVIESKSRWTFDEFADVGNKVESIKSIMTPYAQTLAGELAMIRTDIEAVRAGVDHAGMLIARPRIGVAAVFLSGGVRAFENGEIPYRDKLGGPEDRWPDLILLLEPGSR